MNDNVLFALLLTLIAGLSTGVGSVCALFAKRTNTKFLSLSLGFSAGVMLYVAMLEILPKAQAYLSDCLGEQTGNCFGILAFFGGIIFIGIIDCLLPSAENDIGSKPQNEQNRLKRMGAVTALTIGIHNFPEGMATFTSALKNPGLGLAIAVAIAIHNIPEGIATSLPIYFSGGSKKKAFSISFLSGMTEPVGALLGYLLLRPFFNDFAFGIIFGAVAGIMVFISLEELIPAAHEYEKSKAAIIGVIVGMAVMAVSLLMLT